MAPGALWETSQQNSRSREELTSIQQGSLDPALIQKEREISMKLNELLAAEEDFWHQRAKAQFILEGDRNTKFFHIVSTKCKRRNTILAILNTEGDWKADTRTIRHIFVEYNKKLFTSAKPDPIPNEFSFRATTHI